MNISAFTSFIPTSGGIILLLKKSGDAWKMGMHCSRLDSKSGGAISESLKLIKSDIDFVNSGKLDDGINSVVVLYVDSKDSTKQIVDKGGSLCSLLKQKSKLQQWTLINDTECDTLEQANCDYNVWLGFGMKNAANNLYSTSPNKDAQTLQLYKENHNKDTTKYFESLLDGITLTKTLVTMPPNVLTPQAYVERIKQEFSGLNVDIQVLDRAELQKHNMNCLLNVAQGSANDPYVVILHLKNNNSAPLALVGKGVTFDTGGLSLKPANAMTGMKKDMAGSAAVVGAIKTLALTESDVNVFGVVGLVENSVNGNSYRPDDIIISAASKSIEIGNTDAEGRLVLCDLLNYVQNTLKCKEIIDIATLTGAMVVALGKVYAGLFSNDDKFAYHIANAGKKAGERLWRMPLDPDYAKLLKSKVADLNNISAPLSGAGSITAAEFLHEFVEPGTCWAHLDIAGTACDTNNNTACDDGTTGFGTRLLVDFINTRTKD